LDPNFCWKRSPFHSKMGPHWVPIFKFVGPTFPLFGRSFTQCSQSACTLKFTKGAGCRTLMVFSCHIQLSRVPPRCVMLWRSPEMNFPRHPRVTKLFCNGSPLNRSRRRTFIYKPSELENFGQTFYPRPLAKLRLHITTSPLIVAVVATVVVVIVVVVVAAVVPPREKHVTPATSPLAQLGFSLARTLPGQSSKLSSSPWHWRCDPQNLSPLSAFP